MMLTGVNPFDFPLRITISFIYKKQISLFKIHLRCTCDRITRLGHKSLFIVLAGRPAGDYFKGVGTSTQDTRDWSYLFSGAGVKVYATNRRLWTNTNKYFTCYLNQGLKFEKMILISSRYKNQCILLNHTIRACSHYSYFNPRPGLNPGWPGSKCSVNRKNGLKNQPGRKFQPWESVGFNPGPTRIQPGSNLVWTENSVSTRVNVVDEHDWPDLFYTIGYIAIINI